MKRYQFRPQLEALDARVVPAISVWTGNVDSNFDEPGNWIGRVPVSGDDIEFRPQVTAIVDGEPVYGVSIGVGNMHGDTSAYNSVTLDPNYTAIVTVTEGFTTRAFSLLGGRIDQPDEPGGTDITVIGGSGRANPDFYWTGGTLNGTSNVATVTITGSSTTGLIAPANAGTVGLGSNLTLDNGAVLTIGAGELDFLNDAMEIDINANSGVNVAPGPLGTTTMGGNVVQGDLTKINAGGWYKVSGGIVNGDTIAIDNRAGTFTLDSGSKLSLGKKVPGAVQPTSFRTWGTDNIAADATLTVASAFYKSGGTISIGCGAKPATGFDANIVGLVYISSGNIS